MSGQDLDRQFSSIIRGLSFECLCCLHAAEKPGRISCFVGMKELLWSQHRGCQRYERFGRETSIPHVPVVPLLMVSRAEIFGARCSLFDIFGLFLLQSEKLADRTQSPLPLYKWRVGGPTETRPENPLIRNCDFSRAQFRPPRAPSLSQISIQKNLLLKLRKMDQGNEVFFAIACQSSFCAQYIGCTSIHCY